MLLLFHFKLHLFRKINGVPNNLGQQTHFYQNLGLSYEIILAFVLQV